MPGANLSKLTWEIIPGRPARCIAIPFETRARSFLTDSPSSSSFFSLILSKKRQFRYFFSLLEPRNIVKDLLERIVSLSVSVSVYSSPQFNYRGLAIKRKRIRMYEFKFHRDEPIKNNNSGNPEENKIWK